MNRCAERLCVGHIAIVVLMDAPICFRRILDQLERFSRQRLECVQLAAALSPQSGSTSYAECVAALRTRRFCRHLTGND